MADFMGAAAGFVVAMVALGLVRVLRGPANADRIMAAQLLGTGGIAALLLLSRALEMPAAVDIALVLALLAASVSIALSGAPPARRQIRHEIGARCLDGSGSLRRRILLHGWDCGSVAVS
jgi:multicomponent Na+:H+ antiporter subunit F